MFCLSATYAAMVEIIGEVAKRAEHALSAVIISFSLNLHSDSRDFCHGLAGKIERPSPGTPDPWIVDAAIENRNLRGVLPSQKLPQTLFRGIILLFSDLGRSTSGAE
jgi:hypothetical protein